MIDTDINESAIETNEQILQAAEELDKDTKHLYKSNTDKYLKQVTTISSVNESELSSDLIDCEREEIIEATYTKENIDIYPVEDLSYIEFCELYLGGADIVDNTIALSHTV